MVLDGPSFQVGELPTCTVHQGIRSADVPRLDLGHMQVGSRIPLHHRTRDENSWLDVGLGLESSMPTSTELIDPFGSTTKHLVQIREN